MHYLTALESDYHSAKLRLQAAQQEKLEAAAEFLAARAALHQKLEMLWPDARPCGEPTISGSDALVVPGYF